MQRIHDETFIIAQLGAKLEQKVEYFPYRTSITEFSYIEELWKR